jgi:SAM-dependent methyltransferase
LSDAASGEQIEAARAYEALLVPALFAQWPPRLLEAARIRPGDRVLDVACGTGVLARAAAGRVGPRGQVAGLDLDAGMLALARRADATVEWRQGRAEALPWNESTFDAVLSQFGLMYFPDPQAALLEMLRVLRPGGRLGLAVWASLERTEVYPELVAVLDRIAGAAAADALRAPFALGDVDTFGRMLRSAGAGEVEVVQTPGRARFPSLHALVDAEVRGWLPLMGVVLEEVQVAAVHAASEQALGRFLGADGTLAFAAPALLARGRR